jgi:hypothetical protein
MRSSEAWVAKTLTMYINEAKLIGTIEPDNLQTWHPTITTQYARKMSNIQSENENIVIMTLEGSQEPPVLITLPSHVEVSFQRNISLPLMGNKS